MLHSWSRDLTEGVAVAGRDGLHPAAGHVAVPVWGVCVERGLGE